MNKDSISQRFELLQKQIVADLNSLDDKSSFQSDSWVRKEGGGGITMTIANGNVIEKGGVAFSKVYGPVSQEMKVQLKLEGEEFFATGVSIVLHPNNPWVPIIHMNVRYFELSNGTYWFGGGIDLTPHYIIDHAAKDFHLGLKTICDKYNPNFYPEFKQWADDYFYIPHRNETRGVGGIFFDHLKENNQLSKTEIFNMCVELGETFPKLYGNQVALFKDESFNEENISWRNHRRGRYVEFNLVNDRGTKFGLFSGGRTESILMSLPPIANWTYCLPILDGSLEQITQTKLIKGFPWIDVE
jgi:coproporphyrinogen III oxidase